MIYRPKSGYVVAEITRRVDELTGRRYHVTRYLMKCGAGMYELGEDAIHSHENAQVIAARWHPRSRERQTLRILRVRSFADQKKRLAHRQVMHCCVGFAEAIREDRGDVDGWLRALDAMAEHHRQEARKL